MKRSIHFALFASCLAALGCSGSSTAPPPADFDVVVDELACGVMDAPAAVIDISERTDAFHSGDFSRLEARVRVDGPNRFHEVAMSEGSCRYLKKVTTVCDPGCGPDEFCDASSQCVKSPEGVSPGTLSIKGLGETIHIEPASFAKGVYDGPSPLDADLFDENDAIGARFSDDTYSAESVGVNGVAPMDRELTDAGFEMLDGEDAVLTWTAGPNPDACIRVVINGSNIVHGAPLEDIIECETTDNGSLTIPRALVEAFPGGETLLVTEGFDWPHSELTRYSRSRMSTKHGEAELLVRSSTFFRPNHLKTTGTP